MQQAYEKGKYLYLIFSIQRHYLFWFVRWIFHSYTAFICILSNLVDCQCQGKRIERDHAFIKSSFYPTRSIVRKGLDGGDEERGWSFY